MAKFSSTPQGVGEAGNRRRAQIQGLAANHALDVVRRYLTGLPIG